MTLSESGTLAIAGVHPYHTAAAIYEGLVAHQLEAEDEIEDDEPYLPEPDSIAEATLKDGSIVQLRTWSNYEGLFCDRCPRSECTYQRTSSSCGTCHVIDLGSSGRDTPGEVTRPDCTDS